MSWTLVGNHTSKDTNTVSSDTLAFTSNNDPSSEGNHIIIVCGRFGNSGGTLGASDTAGNTYTPATAQSSNSYEVDSGNSQTDACFLLWAPVTHSNVANTVTITAKTGGSHRFSWAIFEFAPGAGTTVSLDAGPVATQFGSGVTAFNVGPVTTTGSSDLVFTVAQADTTQTTWTVNSPWTAAENTSSHGFAGTLRAVGAYQLNVGAASYTGSITASTGSSGSGIIISFSASSASFQPEEDLWDGSRSVVTGLLQLVEVQSPLVAIQAIPMVQPEELPQAPQGGGLGETDVDYWLLLIVQPSQDILNVYS